MKNAKLENFDEDTKIEELEKIISDLNERTEKYLDSVASNYVEITKIHKTLDKLKMSIKKLWGAIAEIRKEISKTDSSIF